LENWKKLENWLIFNKTSWFLLLTYFIKYAIIRLLRLIMNEHFFKIKFTISKEFIMENSEVKKATESKTDRCL